MLDERIDDLADADGFLALVMGLASLGGRYEALLAEPVDPRLPLLEEDDPAVLIALGLAAWVRRGAALPLTAPLLSPAPRPAPLDLLR
jgi:hypothetical protein